jgi:hypothetical protein
VSGPLLDACFIVKDFVKQVSNLGNIQKTFRFKGAFGQQKNLWIVNPSPEALNPPCEAVNPPPQVPAQMALNEELGRKGNSVKLVVDPFLRVVGAYSSS